MPKITASNTKSLFIAYIIKIILSSLASVLLLSIIISFITVKLDVDLKLLQYFSIIVTSISSLIISSVSISGFKNNYLMLSIISVIPLMLFSIINFSVSHNISFGIEIIKLVLILIISVLYALYKSTRKAR